MAKAVAFGSVTISDLSDLAELTVLPMSNLPLSVIYDPNYNTYTPNWATSNLELTPSVYYGGTNVALGSTGLTITWERQEGTSGKTPLTTGETVTDSVLTVSANKFNANSTAISYFVTASYIEPITGQTLVSMGQITFSMIKNGSWAQTCTIVGDSIFKYDTDQQISGASSITLTGNVNKVSIVEWQYLDANGDYVKYPGSGTTGTLVVNESDNVFVNDKCTIKLTTSDAEVYDIHVITKLRDGARGTDTVSAVLSNDNQMIPFSGGSGDFSVAISQLTIYEGGVNVTETWAITQSYSGVTATASQSAGAHGSANDTTTVTAFSSGVSAGNVTFTATKTGYNTITKKFSLVKVESGVDGVSPTVYSVETETPVLIKATNNTFTPPTITFKAYQQTGDSKTAYNGRLQIFENITLEEYDAASPKPTPDASSSTNESSHTYTPTTSARSFLCILYEKDAFTTRLDAQLAVVASDGQKGEDGKQGPQGEGAVNVIWGNHSDVLTCTHDNKIAAAQTIRIPFYGFKGTERVTCTVTSVNLLGVAPTKQDSTASQDGFIQWVLPAGTSVPSENGTLSITFSIAGQNVVEQYSWSRNTQAVDGQNVVVLDIYTPNGVNQFDQNISSIVLTARLMDGSADVTADSSVAYQWAKLVSGAYQDLPNGTGSTYTVQSSTVESYASFRLTATYNGNAHTAFFAVFDKTDPIQVSVLSSIGAQIINGEGVGAIYVKVTQGADGEVDKIKSERFLEQNPSTAKNGDYYYKLDSVNKAVTLMKYTTAWGMAPPSEGPKGTYKWTWRNKDGEIITKMNNFTLPTTGKVIYIDGAMIDKKIVADVEVEI